MVYFVPLAVAGAKVFFKFASKKAAQSFKAKYSKAGSVTTRAPSSKANVVTTNSTKGKSVLRDMKSPVTQPSIRARNPNTTTLPKKPGKKGGRAGAAVAAGTATAVGVGASSTSTSKSADKSSTAPKRTPMSSVGGKSPSAKKKKDTGSKAREAARMKRGQERLRDKVAELVAASRKGKTSDEARREAMKNVKRGKDKKTMTSDKARRQAMKRK